jgi:BA14K-like protein
MPAVPLQTGCLIFSITSTLDAAALINGPGSPDMFNRTMTRPLRACLLNVVLALAGAGIAAPAHAQTAYDGHWSVVITTRGGACQSGVRFGVDISNGQLLSPAGGMADVQGRVMAKGAVRVTVRSGDSWAVGSGRLDRLTGGGAWRGQGSSGACDGTWVAERSETTTAQAAPRYNYTYAPAPAARAPAAAAPSVEACAAHFKSYDRATGTFLGYDGQRHRCP